MPIDFTGIEEPLRREQIDFSGIEGIDFSGVDEKPRSTFSSLLPILAGEGVAYAKQKAKESLITPVQDIKSSVSGVKSSVSEWQAKPFAEKSGTGKRAVQFVQDIGNVPATLTLGMVSPIAETIIRPFAGQKGVDAVKKIAASTTPETWLGKGIVEGVSEPFNIAAKLAHKGLIEIGISPDKADELITGAFAGLAVGGVARGPILAATGKAKAAKTKVGEVEPEVVPGEAPPSPVGTPEIPPQPPIVMKQPAAAPLGIPERRLTPGVSPTAIERRMQAFGVGEKPRVERTGTLQEQYPGVESVDIEKAVAEGKIGVVTPEFSAERKAKANIEPWQMTREEFKKHQYETERYTPRDIVESELQQETHRQYIQQAISEGKPVPAKVLKDYPELKKKTPELEPVSTTEQGGFLRLGMPKKKVEGPNISRIKGQDATVAAKGFTNLQVADKYPEIKPIIDTSIDAEMTWNHRRNQMQERLTTALDKVEKPSVVQRLFGRKSTTLTDIPDWIRGKKSIPEKYRGFVDEVKTIFKEYRDREIKGREDKILAGLNNQQREIYSRVRNGEDINTIEKVNKTARRRVDAAVKDVNEAHQWGQDPETYFPEAFSGSYKFMDKRGNILASGETARQAAVRLNEFLEENPHRQGEQFIGTSTLAELFETRKALKEETGEPYRSAFDYLGTVLPRKQYGVLLGKINTLANKAAKEALGELGMKIKVDLRGVASPTPRKKFVGFMQKKSTTLKGDIQDPFKVMMSYIDAMERKFAVDDMRAKNVPLIEALPASQANLKEIATKSMDWAGHYSWEDRLVDEGRRKLAETGLAKRTGVSGLLRGKPFLATRVFAKGMGGEANLKLGYAPVKAVINAIDGVVHSMFKSGVKNWFEGGTWLKTSDGKRIWDEKGFLTGTDMPFTTSGRESYAKVTINLAKPLGMFNWPEIKLNRPRAFAAAFVKATKAGATEAQAIKTAIESTRLSQGVYTIASLPTMVRGPLLKSTYQFKQFMMNRIRFIKTLTPMQWAAYLPYILSISGTKGAWLTIKSILPLTIIGALFIDKGEELSEEMNVKQPYLHRGLPGFVVGQDWAAPSTWQLPQSTQDLVGPMIKDAYNTGQMVVKGMKNGNWTDNEINDYFSQLAPTMKNIYNAFQILSEGKTAKGTKTERKVPNPWEAVANIAGARSVEESAESDTSRYIKKKTQDFNERQRVMMDKFFEASEDGDASKILKQMIHEGMIPQKVTANGLEYDFSGLKRSATDRQLTKLQRIIRSAPQPIKRDYYQRQRELKNERQRTVLPWFKGRGQSEKSAER